MLEHTTLRSVLILLAAAVLVVVVLKRVRLPTVIAYLATGFIVGPHGLGWVANSENTRNLAEFGVVFLLFTLGLEFSLARLVAMRKAVFVLGGLQVVLTAAGVALAAWLFGVPFPVAIVLGGAFAMSSTAVVVKQLGEQNELNQPHGRLTIAVLLFQDLAVIPFLILVPGLAHGIGPELARALLLAFAKGAGAVVVILAFGRWLLRPLFHQIATTRSAELFTLAVLLFTLASAWGTAALGLSLALGAFMAGMTLAETEYRHQVAADIRPFRDILLGLFFVTVGMLINPHTIARHWWLLIVSVILLMLFKTLLVAGLTRLLGSDRVTALRSGLVLNQGGEFGFALLALGLAQAAIRAPVAEFALAVIVLSMLAGPVLIRFNGALAERAFARDRRGAEQRVQHDIGRESLDMREHVLIVGYGRVGQNVARFLEPEGFGFVALDLDPVRVRQAREAGDPVYFGDATNPAVLKAAGLEHARAVVISYFHIPVALRILHQVKKLRADVPVLVRTRDDAELDQLMQAGATEVIPETLESSLMVATHLLQLLGVPMKKILRMIRDVRADRYSLMRSVFRGQDALPLDDSHAFREQLDSVTLEPGAYAVNKSLEELNLRSSKVVVTALRREGVVGRQPAADTVLKAGDILVLWGTPEDLEAGEELLLRGARVKATIVKGAV